MEAPEPKSLGQKWSDQRWGSVPGPTRVKHVQDIKPPIEHGQGFTQPVGWGEGISFRTVGANRYPIQQKLTGWRCLVCADTGMLKRPEGGDNPCPRCKPSTLRQPDPGDEDDVFSD